MSDAMAHAADSAPPPYREVAAALRSTTERLAQELASPSADPPDWSTFEWNVARSVAAMHGISALLAHRLRWHGPTRWEDFLREQVTQGLLRDVRIGELLTSLDTLARREAVGLVGLKGAALRVLGFYVPGERPMGDIDIYAPPSSLPAAARVLAALGYCDTLKTARHIAYSRGPAMAPHGFGEHIDNSIKIELHSRVAEHLPVTQVDITSRLAPCPLEQGLHGYRNRAALMAHLLLHAAGNMRAHALRLLQLHDIARLSVLMDANDWSDLLDSKKETLWWVYPPLVLAMKYCDVRVPCEVSEHINRLCPPLLARSARRRMLTDVSWSNLRISAFPGIEWSRSPGEAVRFARSRLIPSRAALDELSGGVREQPHLVTIPWYTRSHPVRIMKWVFGRPPRVQTMSSVLAALGDG
jgi:hypothetical protein